MTKMSRNPEAIARMIREAQRIAICSHINPDGDTLGCAAAMRLALLKMGKEPVLFCDGKVPDQLTFLPGIAEMRMPTGDEKAFDLMLAVDVSDIKRLGSCETLICKSRHTAQIDHHPTNPLFMEENSVDGGAPAACILIREQIAALGQEIDKDMAICLYTGISTDTGNFAFASTNAECFEIMSELMGKELPLAKLNRILFRERAKPQVLLMGRALNSLQYYENGKIAVMKLTQRDFDECEALSEHADTLVNFGLDTVGTRMAMLAREAEDGTIKFSLRAKEPDCISDIAQSFGGGGHPQAAGITIYGKLDETTGNVLDAMIRKLNG
ncbi:MAG: bifunctional oligoribonuclease/PAP phosphatase NrnA [Clostridia bacterium]|nr:bifunctional oligoribonuclease/PAP phosphatase NrnA [Clostridia bacterium]